MQCGWGSPRVFDSPLGSDLGRAFENSTERGWEWVWGLGDNGGAGKILPDQTRCHP